MFCVQCSVLLSLASYGALGTKMFPAEEPKMFPQILQLTEEWLTSSPFPILSHSQRLGHDQIEDLELGAKFGSMGEAPAGIRG